MIKNIKSEFNTLEMYNIFSNCMYMSTWENFSQRAMEYMNDESVSIFGYYIDNQIYGVIVIQQQSDKTYEIKGIATEFTQREKGIAMQLIKFVCCELPISTLIAETDDDAVGFYKKCGFEAEEFIKTGDSGEYKRYRCTMKINLLYK